MRKLAIILDSFCGQTKNEVEKTPGMYFVPLQIEINAENFKVGMTKSGDDKIKTLLFKKLPSRTSMPTPNDLLTAFKKASQDAKDVIYLPLSSSISGTAKMAMGLAQDFNNVTVIESHLVGENLFLLSKYLMETSQTNDHNIGQIKQKIIKYAQTCVSPAFVIPKTIDALVRTGRIGKIASNILGKMKAIPLISYEWDERKLHNKGIKRSTRKAIAFAITKINAFIAERPNFKFLVTTTPNREMADIAEQMFINNKYDYIIKETSPIIISAVGEIAISISAFQII